MGGSPWASRVPRGSYLPWPEVVPAFEAVKIKVTGVLNSAKQTSQPHPEAPSPALPSPLLILAVLSYSYPNTPCSFRPTVCARAVLSALNTLSFFAWLTSTDPSGLSSRSPA